ncbi:MAG: winged helix-turn-helix domain-containing protein [Victivallaceae bacterium]|nr:winged helix-turn-helix domain-containing protein [Victivallaceae bacterium]
MVIPEKSRNMIRLLRERILAGSYSSGQRLPSIRMLMAEFSLSNGSVKKGIDYLAEQGLVETIHGSGTFIKRHSSCSGHSDGDSTKSIAVFGSVNPSNEQGIYASVLMGMMRAADANGCQLQLNPLPLSDLTSDYIAKQSGGTDGILFLHEVDAVLSALPLNLPSVGVCVHLPVGNSMSFVNLDPWSSAQQSMEYFKQHDIERIEIIAPQHPAYCHRATVFAEAWRNVGGLVSEHYYDGGDSDEEFEFIEGIGYLFATCSTMQHYLERFKRRNGALPDNIILGMDGKNFMYPNYYSMPAIMLDWEQVGEVAFDECLRRINNPGNSPRRIYLSGYLRIEN